MKLQLAILVAMVSSGCVTNEKYPDDWAALEQPAESQAGNCPDISGRYSDRSVVNVNEVRSLTNVLSSGDPSSWDSDSSGVPVIVEIRQPSENVILVKPSLGEEFQLVADEGHFACEEGVLHLKRGSGFGFGGIVIGGGSSVYSLFKSEDQSLMARQSVIVGGLFTIIPVVMGGKFWIARWVPVDENYEPLEPIPLTPKEMESMARLSGQLNDPIGLPDTEILFESQASLSYSMSGVTYSCYAEELVLTEQRIYAVWNRFPVRSDCQPPDRGHFSFWDYTEVLSIEAGSLPQSLQLNMRCNNDSEEDANNCPSDTLVVLSMDEVDMHEIEEIVRERVTPN